MSIRTHGRVYFGAPDKQTYLGLNGAGLPALVIGGASVLDWTAAGAPGNGGLLLGKGTSSARYAMGATADKAMLKFYGDALNATGYARVLDARLYFGAAGGGEAVRAYGIVNGVTAAVGETVNGIHATLELTGAAAAISGGANAMRGTFTVGTGVTPGGTLAVLELDSNVASAVTVPDSHAFIAFRNIGAVNFTRLFEVPNVASGGMLAAHTTDAVTHSIRIRSADGTLYYLMATTTVTNRTGGG